MTMLHVEVDEATAEAIRQQAQRAGKTPEAWLAEMAMQQKNPPGTKSDATKISPNAEEVRGNSGGVKWTREELYDREAARRDVQLEAQSKALEKWIAEVMAGQPSSTHTHGWLDEFLAIALAAGGNSRGEKWSRNDMYDG